MSLSIDSFAPLKEPMIIMGQEYLLLQWKIFFFLKKRDFKSIFRILDKDPQKSRKTIEGTAKSKT